MSQNSVWLSDPKLILGLVGLYITYQRFQSKKGVEVRGDYALSYSTDCEDPYISRVNLENQKDRAITIYALYLKIGRACYITLQDFSDKPLILKPFESFRVEYGPIEFYMANSNRLSINSSLKNEKLKKVLYISTATGKCRVKSPPAIWSPLAEASKNSYTVMANTIRGSHKGHTFGSEAKYLVELVREDSKNTFFSIYSDDYKVRRFKEFQLTTDALKSFNSMRQFFDNPSIAQSFEAQSIIIHDLDEWRKDNLKFYFPHGKITVPDPNWFEYFVVNRLRTIYRNYRSARSLKAQLKRIKTEMGKRNTHEESQEKESTV